MSRFTAVTSLLWFTTLPVAAHTVSMSTSRLDVQGTRARLEIRVPAYEVRHVADPARAIPATVQIDGAGPANSTCTEEGGTYVCRSEYALSGAGPVRVRCLLAKAIVANHVHVMHATRDGRIDQAVFDATLEDARLTFRHAGPIENAVRTRPRMIGVLVLAMLAISVLPVSPRDALWACGAFFSSAGLASLVGLPWQLTPGFLEVALAVVAAYSAFEVIALESSAWRLVAGALLGIVFGRYALTLAGAPSSAAALAAGVVCAAFGIPWIWRRFPGARNKVGWVTLAAAITWIAVALL